ncbi:hypothetical protein SAMN02745164_02179 [Marinitoga hydrogenitolerans DSM 16785]|uniref:Uncharacterized protein n=1 Tax=Marinitoga hydrogenitolerans (strain DSM 16785 / JCM 12826 / AT1271) TaxID=1122195 RepID=A0A1M5AFK4_MARH1|nr:hypothetical protein [Marinitoga hydrogenitolerans]SHF29080.1 hypothetical protein SAMN02745164_02179 [Marinitoga hydrogenitolerans DSM 16785]
MNIEIIPISQKISEIVNQIIENEFLKSDEEKLKAFYAWINRAIIINSVHGPVDFYIYLSSGENKKLKSIKEILLKKIDEIVTEIFGDNTDNILKRSFEEKESLNKIFNEILIQLKLKTFLLKKLFEYSKNEGEKNE